MTNELIFKKFLLLVIPLIFCGILTFGEVKVINLPDEIKVEENGFKETVVRNLTEEAELFKPQPIFLIGEYFYVSRLDPPEIIKFSMEGKLVGRVGREGQGPGELGTVRAISESNGNLALLDYKRLRLINYSQSLRYIDEHKIPKQYMGFFLNKNNEFIFYCEPSTSADFYFTVYSSDLKMVRAFGNVKSSVFNKTQRKTKGKFDSVKSCVYIPEEEGIWCSFMNRYELWHFKNEKLCIKIEAQKDFFRRNKYTIQGHTFKRNEDFSQKVAVTKKYLYHFFLYKKQCYCDFFDLKNYTLVHRYKLKGNYRAFVHSNQDTFYGIAYQMNEEDDFDVVLYKIDFN